MLTPFFTGKLGGPYKFIMELAPILERKGISTNFKRKKNLIIWKMV